jgi:hypothetical protein
MATDLADVLGQLERFRASVPPAAMAHLDQVDASVRNVFADLGIPFDDSHARAALLGLLLVPQGERSVNQTAIASCIALRIGP